MADEQIDRVADQVGGRLVSGIEQKDAVVDQFELRQSLALFAARSEGAGADQGGEDFRRIVVAGPQPARNDLAEVVLELGDCRDAGIEFLPAEHRLERAEDGERPSAQRATLILRNPQHVADKLHRNGGGEIGNEVDLAALGRALQEAVDQRLDARLQGTQCPRRERRREQPAHPRVIGRIVEDEARRVMLVEQAVGKIRPEVEPLVRAPGVHVPVHRKAVVIAGEEAGPIGHAMDRVELAECPVGRIRVGEEFSAQPAQVEFGCRAPATLLRRFSQSGRRCAAHCLTRGQAGLGGPNACSPGIWVRI